LKIEYKIFYNFPPLTKEYNFTGKSNKFYMSVLSVLSSNCFDIG